MTYGDFYKIAEYMNECSNNIFTKEGIACNAYDYFVDYNKSVVDDKPTKDMIILCTELMEDMDCHDYDDFKNEIDIKTMEKVFEEFLENY